MGIITIKATPVSPFASQNYVPPGFPVTPLPTNGQAYNWVAQNNQLGDYDIGRVWADLPGPYAGFNTVFLKPESAATTAGTVTSPVYPAPVFTVSPGQIITAWEPTLGWGEFIALRNPISTALPVGTLVTWDATYNIGILSGTTKNTGQPVAVAVSSAAVGTTAQALTQGTVYPITPLYDGSGLASQANQITIAWYQISGRAWTLKTAVQVTPNVPIFVGAVGTNGRFKVLSSTGGQILGARAATGTTTTTQSLALVYYGTRAMTEGA
jgi:hypothetical protein